jgi:protocatechuate 3,4-dioxygenase beta subunit
MTALMALANGPITTDDRGAYRAYGLPPGEYLVQTQTETGSIPAVSPEIRPVTPAEVQWAQQAASQAPGGIVNPAAPPTATSPEPARSVAYAPVYYPGTTVASEALLVTLGPGEERRGIDLSRQLVPTAKISGVILDVDGRPLPSVQVSLKSTDAESSDIASMILGSGGTRTGAEGAFTMSGVRPGRYVLTARGGPRQDGRQAAGPLDAMLGGRGAAAADMSGELGALMGIFGTPQPWWAREEIAIEGRDIADLTLRLQPGMAVSGRIVFEGASPPPADVTKTRVSFGAVPTSSSPIELAMSSVTGGNAATTAADGTFTVKGIVPGRYRGSVGGGPAAILAMFTGGAQQPNNWTLKSMMWNGRDIADVPFDVKPNEDITGVVVSFTDRPTELSGTVFDQTGHATGNFPIVVFSTDKAYWTIGSRRVQQARPASDGKFKIAGLPAGEYVVCAVTDLDPEDLYTPAFLDQLMGSGAYRIRLADGEKRVQDLKLAGGGF